MKCVISQCQHEGTEEPVFRFPRINDKVTPGIRGQIFGLVVCAEHGNATIEEVLSDAAWARISAAYDAVGLAVPDRATINLSFDHMTL